MGNEHRDWKLAKIKSIRVSSELLEMLEREATYRNTTFSDYARYAMVMQMKFVNKSQEQKQAA